MKRLILVVFIMALVAIGLSGIANAADTGGKLIISKIDAKVGGRTSKNLLDGNTIGRDAEPKDVVEFTVELLNNYTTTENVDIEGITVLATIKGIDDGEDMDKESNEFTLRPGRDKSVSLNFNLLLEIDEGSYDVELIAEGRDEKGNSQSQVKTIVLVVDKQRHDVRRDKASLFPTKVGCTRRGVQLTAGVINVGSEDEEKATLAVTSPELNLNYNEVFDIDSGAFDDSVKFSKTYTFNVPDALAAGTYPIKIRSAFNDNEDSVESIVDITVEECVRPTTTTTTTSTSTSSSTTTTQPKNTGGSAGGSSDSELVELVMPKTPATTTTTTTVKPAEAKKIFSNNVMVGLLVGAEVLGALIIIGIIIRFARK